MHRRGIDSLTTTSGHTACSNSSLLATLEFDIGGLAPGASTLVTIAAVNALGGADGDELPTGALGTATLRRAPAGIVPQPVSVLLLAGGVVALGARGRWIRRQGRALTLLLLGLAIPAMTVQAAVINVDNPGFENDPAAAGTFPLLTPEGWELFNPDGVFNGFSNSIGVLNPTGSTFFAGAPEGSNVALVFLAASPGSGEMGLFQGLGDVLGANTRYSLSVEVGNIASGTGLPPFDVFGFFDLDGFPGYRVELLAGTTAVGADDNSLFASIPEGEFRTSTIDVQIGASHAALGQALGIRLINLSLPGTPGAPGIEVDFDDVQLTATAVPGPASGFLVAVGTLAALVLRRAPRAQPVGQRTEHHGASDADPPAAELS